VHERSTVRPPCGRNLGRRDFNGIHVSVGGDHARGTVVARTHVLVAEHNIGDLAIPLDIVDVPAELEDVAGWVDEGSRGRSEGVVCGFQVRGVHHRQGEVGLHIVRLRDFGDGETLLWLVSPTTTTSDDGFGPGFFLGRGRTDWSTLVRTSVQLLGGGCGDDDGVGVDVGVIRGEVRDALIGDGLRGGRSSRVLMVSQSLELDGAESIAARSVGPAALVVAGAPELALDWSSSSTSKLLLARS
jgi:hypothetical protein